MILSKEIQRIKSEVADISLKMLYGKTAEEIVKEILTNEIESDIINVSKERRRESDDIS